MFSSPFHYSNLKKTVIHTYWKGIDGPRMVSGSRSVRHMIQLSVYGSLLTCNLAEINGASNRREESGSVDVDCCRGRVLFQLVDNCCCNSSGTCDRKHALYTKTPAAIMMPRGRSRLLVTGLYGFTCMCEHNPNLGLVWTATVAAISPPSQQRNLYITTHQLQELRKAGGILANLSS